MYFNFDSYTLYSYEQHSGVRHINILPSTA